MGKFHVLGCGRSQNVATKRRATNLHAPRGGATRVRSAAMCAPLLCAWTNSYRTRCLYIVDSAFRLGRWRNPTDSHGASGTLGSFSIHSTFARVTCGVTRRTGAIMFAGIQSAAGVLPVQQIDMAPPLVSFRTSCGYAASQTKQTELSTSTLASWYLPFWSRP